MNMNKSVEKEAVVGDVLRTHDTMWKVLPKDSMLYGPIGDAPNLSRLIGDFADFRGIRGMKKRALTGLILENQMITDDETPGKYFTYCGITIVIGKCEENYEGEGYHPDHAIFWDHGDCVVPIRTIGSGLLETIVVGNCEPDCAEQILHMMELKNLCLFCCKLFPRRQIFGVVTKDPVCRDCCSCEMEYPCSVCKIQMGIADSNTGTCMHRACKRRKLNE